MEKKCPKCGEMVEAEDTGRPCDSYYCECGWTLCDVDGYTDRMMANADYMRKQQREGGL